MPKVLKEKRRHTVGPRGFWRVHLFKGLLYFCCYIWLSEELVHIFCDAWFDWLDYMVHVSNSFWREQFHKKLPHNPPHIFHTRNAQSLLSLSLRIVFLILLCETFLWKKKVVLWSPSFSYNARDLWNQKVSSLFRRSSSSPYFSPISFTIAVVGTLPLNYPITLLPFWFFHQVYRKCSIPLTELEATQSRTTREGSGLIGRVPPLLHNFLTLLIFQPHLFEPKNPSTCPTALGLTLLFVTLNHNRGVIWS